MRITVRNFQTRPIIDTVWLRSMTETVLDETGVEVEADAVAFVFVDDPRMSDIHGRWRHETAVTDVLAFPAADAEPGGEHDLGDVILCTDQTCRQARALGLPYPVELRILALHGFLHLLGYDHTRDRGEMRALERRLRPRLLARRGPTG